MFFRIAVREADWVDVCYSLRAVLDRKRSGVLHGSRLSHVVRRRGGMGRAVGRFIEFAARALVIRRTTWRALSHWLRGYGDPPPETVIVVGMTRDFAQSANADLARRYCSETVTTYHSLFPVNHVTILNDN